MGSPANPVLDLTSAAIKGVVYVRTNIGGWFFDAILQTTATSTLTVTSDPVQLGSSISDFAYLQPRELSMNIGMTDTAQSFIKGQFSGGNSRSQTAYQVLQALQTLKIPIQVYHERLGLYENMVIATLTAQDDYTTPYAVRATVDLQEILVATVSVVKVSANPSVTDKQSGGGKQPSQPDQSILSALSSAINGL